MTYRAPVQSVTHGFFVFVYVDAPRKNTSPKQPATNESCMLRPTKFIMISRYHRKPIRVYRTNIRCMDTIYAIELPHSSITTVARVTYDMHL